MSMKLICYGTNDMTRHFRLSITTFSIENFQRLFFVISNAKTSKLWHLSCNVQHFPKLIEAFLIYLTTLFSIRRHLIVWSQSPSNCYGGNFEIPLLISFRGIYYVNITISFWGAMKCLHSAKIGGIFKCHRNSQNNHHIH